MKNLELLYLFFAYGMAGIMFYTTRHKTFPTVSHVALNGKLTRQVFFWGLTISAIIFAVLMYGWAVPEFALGVWLQLIIGILIVSQILTGLFPVQGKRFGVTHTLFASILGICMFILITSFSITETISVGARIFDAFVAISMLILLAASIYVPRGRYLLHEKIFFAFWHIALFVTIYFG